MAGPFPFIDELFSNAARALQPPPWMVEELQRRFVLVVNHVLMQEPEAQARLARQSGKVLQAHWRSFSMRLSATPAGLFEVLPPADTPADLTLTLTEESPLQLAQAALRGDKPPVHIAGDVQFAAEISWLVDNVRWDAEEDLARLVGDAPAHAIADTARRVMQAMREFVARATSAGAPPTVGPEGPEGTPAPGPRAQ
jgi:ubiquinone biosynthesis protein UbiJ